MNVILICILAGLEICAHPSEDIQIHGIHLGSKGSPSLASRRRGGITGPTILTGLHARRLKIWDFFKMFAIIDKLNQEHPEAISYPKLYLESPYSCLYVYQNLSSLAQDFVRNTLCYAIATDGPITASTRYSMFPFNPLSIVAEESRPRLAIAIRQLAELQIISVGKDKTHYDLIFFRNLFSTLNNLPFVSMGGYTLDCAKQHTINPFTSRKSSRMNAKLMKEFVNYCEEYPASRFRKLLDSLMEISSRKSDKKLDEKEEKKLSRFRTIFSLLSLIDQRANVKADASQSSLTETGCQFMLGSDQDQLSIIIYQLLLCCAHAGLPASSKFREFYLATEKYIKQKDQESKWICSDLNDINTTSYATHVVGLIMNLCCLDMLHLHDLETSLFRYYCPFFYWMHSFGLILLNHIKPGAYSLAISPILCNLNEKYVAHKDLNGAFYNAPAEYYRKTLVGQPSAHKLDNYEGTDLEQTDFSAEDLSLLQNYTITESTGRIFVYKTADEGRNEKNKNIMCLLCNRPKYTFPHVDVYELDPQNAKANLASATASFLQKTARLIIARDKLPRGELVVPPTLVNQLEFLQQNMNNTGVLKTSPHVKVYQFQYIPNGTIKKKFSVSGEAITEFSYAMEKCSSVAYYKAVTVAEELGCLIWKHDTAFSAVRSRCNTLMASSYYRSPTVKFLSLQGDMQRTILTLWHKIASFYPTDDNDNIQGLWLLINASFQETFEQEFNAEMVKVSSEWTAIW